jgi:hypothetical protein
MEWKRTKKIDLALGEFDVLLYYVLKRRLSMGKMAETYSE